MNLEISDIALDKGGQNNNSDNLPEAKIGTGSAKTTTSHSNGITADRELYERHLDVDLDAVDIVSSKHHDADVGLSNQAMLINDYPNG